MYLNKPYLCYLVANYVELKHSLTKTALHFSITVNFVSESLPLDFFKNL